MMRGFESLLVVGAGKMGGALVDGWLANGHDPASITLIDPLFAETDAGWTAKGVRVLPSVDGAGEFSPDLLLLAVKPQMMAAVLPGLSGFDRPELTVISIAAGTPLATLDEAFPTALCVRTMPNTPASVGAGITAAFAPKADDGVRGAVSRLLDAVGAVVWVEDEAAMDAVTAISGSGPAYVFHMVEALADAGEALGLPAETAMALARQTVVGAGALMVQSPESAAQLRRNVTSPGGTTAAGLSILRETGRLSALMRDTAKAACARSKALAGPSDGETT